MHFSFGVLSFSNSVFFYLWRTAQMADSMSLDDLYSDNVDPSITLKDVQTLGFGKKFPNKKGFAYAFYAWEQFPLSATLASAINAKKAYKQSRLACENSVRKYGTLVYDFIDEIDGVVIKAINSEHDGSLKANIPSCIFDSNWVYCDRLWSGPKQFVVNSKEEAIQAARAVLEVANRSDTQMGPCKTLLFGRNNCYCMA
jgi:hypothetical protein